jgi:hypothetical protein
MRAIMRRFILALTLLSSPALAQHDKLECARDGFGYLHCVEQPEQRPGTLVVTGSQRRHEVMNIKAMISAGDCKRARRYAAALHDPEIERATKEACAT